MNNIATNWTLKVLSQRKSEDGTSVVLRCLSNGRKKSDGSYEKGMSIVVIVNKDTAWTPEDKSGKYIDVTGHFTHREWNQSLTFSIFASEITDHEFIQRESW